MSKIKNSSFMIYALSSFILISGCQTLRKEKDLEIQGLRNQISVLEAQIQSKDEEIDSLREELRKVAAEKAMQASKKKIIAEVKSRPNAKQIQIALSNAGYDPGPVDGKMGRQTRQAIKAFQRANNLTVDGRAGKKTWALLKKYLYKKIK
jgi:peptidoglycan hydrolase-like protein with peptidoglycan-binding domain